ncbi:hypothetical protein ACTM7U_21580, partial [Citrobacter braakii]
GKNSLNRLIRCVCGKKIGPDPRNFNQRVSLGRNDLLIRTFPSAVGESLVSACDILSSAGSSVDSLYLKTIFEFFSSHFSLNLSEQINNILTTPSIS